jgi:sulfur carrier protein ThiS
MSSSQSPEDTKKQDKHSDTGELFLQFRRKVQASELLSAATVRLLESLSYTGRLTVVLQNGEVLKSGYEEGYFRRRDDLKF